MAAGPTTAEQRAPKVPADAPQLAFQEYAIAFHVVATWCGGGEPPAHEEAQPDERAMDSYEDDMLVHAHRGDPPFCTRVVQTSFERVTVGFAPTLTYEAEGERKQLPCYGATATGRTRTFALTLAQTMFTRCERRGHGRQDLMPAVLTLVLTPPDPPSADSELDEFDVIKLVKLWEGGEGVGNAPSAIEEGADVWFTTEGDERLTLHDLFVRAFREWRPLASSAVERRASETARSRFFRRFAARLPGRGDGALGEEEDSDVRTTARDGYRVGTVELEVPRSSEWRSELFADVATLKRRREASSSGDNKARAIAVGGILQGLVDFRRIDDEELADVFADVDVDVKRRTMCAFHKGTLLFLSAEEEPERHNDPDGNGEDGDRPSPIGVDPYRAVPNIVLLHDEQRLKSARLRERELSLRQRGPLREWRGRAAIAETEDGLGEMGRLLAQHPNLFHYANERRLQKRGRESRGLDDLEAFMRLRMHDLSSVLQWRVRRRDRWTAVLGIAVGVVTAFLVQQAIEGRPLWLIVLAAVALFGVFLWLRDKLF